MQKTNICTKSSMEEDTSVKEGNRRTYFVKYVCGTYFSQSETFMDKYYRSRIIGVMMNCEVFIYEIRWNTIIMQDLVISDTAIRRNGFKSSELFYQNASETAFETYNSSIGAV